MSAREELHESMCGSCGGRYARGECEAVDRLIDNFADELERVAKRAVRFDDPGPRYLIWAPDRENFARELRDHPGRWALLGVHPGTSGSARTEAWSIRNARSRPEFSPAGAYEAEVQTMLGERRIYVRYVGEGVSSDG